ncbi:MAG TPA: hypothetical protein VD862_02530 [Candidatus Paceibacterota bacterium]|nr:hypothetical protein [Candidatus Paceibacterota bacterium]
MDLDINEVLPSVGGDRVLGRNDALTEAGRLLTASYPAGTRLCAFTLRIPRRNSTETAARLATVAERHGFSSWKGQEFDKYVVINFLRE